MRVNLWMRVGTFAAITALTACAAEDPVDAPRGSYVDVRSVVLAEHAIFVEAEPTITHLEALPDRLVLTVSGPLSTPIVRGGAIAVGAGGDGYIRRVLSSTTLPDGRVEVLTESGNIHDVFSDLDIVVHYEPTMSGAVGTPTTLSAGVAGARAGLGDDCVYPCELMSGSVELFGGAGSCSGSVTGGVSLEPYVDTQFNMDFPIDFDTTEAFPFVELVSAGMIATGSVGAGVQLSVGAAAEGTCDVDLAAALGAAEIPLGSLTFWIPTPLPIPVTIVFSAMPIATGSVSVAIDAGEVTARAGAMISATASLMYEDGGWNPPSFSATTTGELSLTTSRAGGLTAGAEVRLGASLSAKFYGAIGPTIALTAGLQADFSADIMCNWDASLTADVQAQFGVTALTVPGTTIELWGGASFDPITLLSTELAHRSGRLTACGVAPDVCDVTMPHCVDMVFDTTVCVGQEGFQACPSGQVQRCTCSRTGWDACSACMALPGA